MDDPSIRRVGAIAAWGVAAAYFLSGLFGAWMPPELQGRPGIEPHLFWTVLSQQPTAHLGFHGAWIVAGLCGIAAVPAISACVWTAQRGPVLWSALAAWLGFATLARSHLMEVAWDRKIIPLYANADPAFQQAVHVVAGLALDVPIGVLTYGAVGLWIALVSVLGRRERGWPAAFALLGCATGLALACGVAGYGLALRPLIVLAVGVGGLLLAPAWFVWAGLLLRRTQPAPGAPW